MKEFITTLINNDYTIKHDPLNEEHDNIDEIKADMHDSGIELSERLRYIEINGHRCSIFLREELDQQFNEFRLYIVENKPLEVIEECSQQIKSAREQLGYYLQNEVRCFDDIGFTDIVRVKMDYCDETLEFLKGYGKQVIDKKPRFKIRPEANKRKHDILAYIHKDFKREGYIDCNLPDFKKVFTSDNPALIVWFKTYAHLSYFIKELSKEFIEDSRKPSKYEVALLYFINHETNKLFEVNRRRCDTLPGKVDKKFIDFTLSNSVGHYLNL
ncbi:hypothetical protein [Carboxylicivirga sp. N1Y90]|uniref:hypothetical protein n=1 Tax=Carboxylicivirga fragile TaxID=3417571 RepID=UPI003D3527A9|nr:hypothetical protein [Marinilabiliaceae bacterium N1Y90]